MAEPTKPLQGGAESSHHEEAITEAGRLGLGPKANAQLAGAKPEPIIYRPLSIWAIAGFAVAVLYAVLVVVGGLAGLILGSPLLLGTWGFLLPIVSAAIAFVGRRQVAHSEGTRAGLKLAVWGWWLSVLFGLSY